MLCEPRPEGIITREDLDDARGKELLGELDKFDTAVWGEWTEVILLAVLERFKEL